MTRASKIGLVFILAGLGGLIRQGMVSQFDQLGLLVCNYGAVYGLVRVTALPRLNQTLTTGVSVGFFCGLSSITPILQQLAQILVVGDWQGFLGLFALHVLGGYGVAILAHGRAIRGEEEVRHASSFYLLWPRCTLALRPQTHQSGQSIALRHFAN